MGLPISAQDAQFSQYYASPLLIAPSFAGNSLGSRAFVSYRDQWAKLPGSFLTYSVGIDHNFYAINSGIGLVFLRDVMGSAKYGMTQIKGLYSYRFNINDDWRIRPGISFSYSQRSIKYSSTIFPDQISETGTSSSSVEQDTKPYYYFDAGSSVVLYNRRMWFGLTADHLLRPNASTTRRDESRIPIQWSQFGGINFGLRNNVGRTPEVISMNYMFKMSEGYYQLDIGANWYRAPLLLGVGWRGLPSKDHPSYDALIFTVGVAFNNIAIGYSYDFTVSNLGPATGGSHEITVSFSFNEGNKSNRRGSIPCPDVVKFKMFGDKESFR
jgi:type IX secretion system PorP/SprF family membrane protein